MRDYEELVGVLRDLSEDTGDECAEAADAIEELMTAEAADAIEELMTYEALYRQLTENDQKVARKLIDAYPKWISVEERLPEESANYLTYGVFLPWGVKAMDLCRFNGKGWMIGQNVKITHWMPLPEPPKEVEYES